MQVEIMTTNIVLAALPLPGSSKPLPHAFTEAESLWTRSSKDAERGNAVAAAAGFISAAEKLRLAPDAPFAGSAKAARAIAYDNATTCWLAGRAFEEARKRLTRALEGDPESAPAIEAALARLPGARR